MPAVITAEERAMIDAKVAVGEVTRCATGASAYNIEYVWSDKINRLVPVDVEAATAIYRKSMTRDIKRKKAAPTPEQIKRREKVASLMDAGHSGQAIARMLGCDPWTVYADAKAMDRSFPMTRPKPRDNSEIQQRRERVAAMAKAGKTAAQIMEVEGVSETTVFSDLRVMGISLSRAKAALKAWQKPARRSKNPGGQPSPVAAARRAKLPAMIAKGMGTAAIARALDTTPSVIRHDCRHLGIPSPGKAREMKEAA